MASRNPSFSWKEDERAARPDIHSVLTELAGGRGLAVWGALACQTQNPSSEPLEHKAMCYLTGREVRRECGRGVLRGAVRAVSGHRGVPRR